MTPSDYTPTPDGSPLKVAFEHCAGDYASYRPAYPSALYDHLLELDRPSDNSITADVGAGTGIFAAGLAARGRSVIAIEPSLAMLRQVPKSVRQRLQARAEQTALRSASVTMVTVAQAFHWFNPPFALAEFARILTLSGHLAFFWNNRDPARSAFVGQFEALIKQYNPAYRREYRTQDWSAKIRNVGGFQVPRTQRFQHDWRLSTEQFIGFTRSVSYIRNVLSADDRQRFEADLRRLINLEFGQDPVCVPLNTDLWTARKG